MKRNILLLFLILFANNLFCQEDLTSELDSLFFNISVETNVKEIIRNSKFSFETYENNDNFLNEKQKIFVADFSINHAIISPILEGQFSIIQRNSQIQTNEYELVQRIHLQNLEDVILDYNNLSKKYEKFGFRILDSTNEGNSYFSSHQNKVISIKRGSKNITLTFMYSIPKQKETGYYLFVICNFREN